MHEPRPLEQLVEQIADTAALSEVHVFHRDDETRSCVSLNGVGAHRYVSDPSTEFLFRAWAVDDGPVQLWVPGDPIPPEAFEAAHNANWLVGAHGDHFETANEEHLLGPRHGWPLVPLERHTCTMARALALGLPAKLHALADALELANRKDRTGERLMHQMTKPRRARKSEDPNGVYWFDDPERMERFKLYCRQDVEVEREAHGVLPLLSPAEQALWVLSCTINSRGFCVDY